MSDDNGMRMRGFLRKEVLQILRDPSSIALALVMPCVLLFIFGYGVRLEAENVPLAIVVPSDSPTAREIAHRFAASRYFEAAYVPTIQEAEDLLRGHHVDAILHMQDDFEASLEYGAAPAQLVLYGVDSNRARLIQGYAGGVLATWVAVREARGEPAPRPGVVVQQRVWFNAAVRSTNFLVPGLMTLVMTLIGVLLTALVVAREWERGTMEAILATPLRPREFMLGKLLPYYALGMAGLALSVVVGVYLFDVPFRGSIAALVLTGSLFMLASLGLGLFLSSMLKVQFVAAQASIVSGFLPAFFLSGMLFDLHSTPWFIQAISRIVPARYFVPISHTLFLAGDVWSVIWPNAVALAVMAAILLALARSRLGLRLEK
jgi:ABC-2 type transport system permease protein